MSFRFTKLPLETVYVRFTLREELPICLPFIRDLFEELRDQYPLLQELTEFEQTPGFNITISTVPGALLGARMIKPSTGLSAFVQSYVVGIRWQKSQEFETADYPLHTVMFQELTRLRDAICNLLHVDDLNVAVANMSYTKCIQGDIRPAGELFGQYYSSELVGDKLLSQPGVHEVNLSWKGEHGIDARFHLQFIDGRGYLIHDSAGAILKEGERGFDKLTSVHSALLSQLKEYITEKAKVEWGYEEL